MAAITAMPGLVAISLGGSAASGLADERSDTDLHVYWREPLAEPAEREALLRAVADPGRVTVDIRSWGLEDHLHIDGKLVELIYVHLGDLRDEIEQAYGPGLSGEGFVTAQLYSVAQGRPLHDPSGELAALRARLLAGYPEPTHRLVLRDNPALLRTYLKHLRLAQERGDLLMVQHRRYTVQMVFFNLLFALNRTYHPGEKRLLAHGERCPLKPASMTARWNDIARLPADDGALAELLAEIAGELIELVEAHQ